MSNKVVAITAGHSNKDTGSNHNGVLEQAYCTGFRNAVNYYLVRGGIKTVTAGTGSDNQSLSIAMRLATQADIAIEFHLNASTNPSVSGVEALSQAKDKKLSQDLAKAVSLVTGSKLRGNSGWQSEEVSPRGKLGFVRSGGIILELGFISNQEEMKVLKEKMWLVAKQVATVIIKYVRG